MAAAEEPFQVGPGPDGEKIVDDSYYRLLGVKGNATDVELKKSYRKLAIRWHPDKNPGDESAAAKFQEISEAFSVLSDSNLRAVYNKQGKKSAVQDATGENLDPGAMFSSLFGGQAFEDWIGEISLGKDVSKAFEIGTTEQEKEEIKKEWAAANNPTAQEPQSTIDHQSFDQHAPSAAAAAPASPAAPSTTTATGKSAPTTATSSASATSPPPTPPAHPSSSSLSTAETAAKKEKKSSHKMTPEQRAQMEAYERERIEEKKERVRTLIEKLKSRIRPFVESANPDDPNDPEIVRFSNKMREQAQDLVMESFGFEICQLIGEVYMQKASSYIKLHRKPAANLLGVPAWWSRMKEKGAMLKEGWSFLSVGLDVQNAMNDLERRQAKGQLDEEEMKKIETDLSGKMLLVAWRGSKFELSSILRQVVDGALSKEDATVTDKTIMNRAKAILVVGAILKSVKPDEADDERRELERMVAEAARKRKEKPSKKSHHASAANPASTSTSTPAAASAAPSS